MPVHAKGTHTKLYVPGTSYCTRRKQQQQQKQSGSSGSSKASASVLRAFGVTEAADQQASNAVAGIP